MDNMGIKIASKRKEIGMTQIEYLLKDDNDASDPVQQAPKKSGTGRLLEGIFIRCIERIACKACI